MDPDPARPTPSAAPACTPSGAAGAPASPTRPRRSLGRRLWREWVRPLAVIAAVGFTFRSAVADWNDVPTGSMKPTILEGDRILVNKLAYGLRLPFTFRWAARWSQPRRGDIVVLFSPRTRDRLVKRVVGVPGDTVEMRDNRLFINGVPAEYGPPDRATVEQIAESDRPRRRFASERLAPSKARAHAVMSTPHRPAQRTFPAQRVPAGHYLVLGDNRDESGDSRSFGFVPERLIVGRTGRVAFSLDRDDWYLPRADRFFRRLD